MDPDPLIMPPRPFADCLLTHPANARVLAWLGVPSRHSVIIGPWVDHGFDQGARTLFYDYAATLPITARYSISYHAVLVHPETSIVYAALHGRFTFLVRHPPGTPAGRRLAETVDAVVRLDGLEDEWAFLPYEEEAEALREAHEAAGRGHG